MATYAEYKRSIRSLIVEHGRLGNLVGPTSLTFSEFTGIPAEKGGVIRATSPGLFFRDHAVLRILEVVQMINGQANRLKYSYHYERSGGYFFRYEREPSDDLQRKPEYHMHAILDLPHFIAPPVTLETILSLITVNFYSQQAYARQIIGKKLNLSV